MPLSEFHRAATKGKPESNQSRSNNCSSTDLSSFIPDNELAELLWENGQIVRKSFLPTPFPSPSLKAQERESRDDKIASVPSSDIGLHAQDDDMVQWMNYPVDDDRFALEFFSELSGIHPNSLSNNDRDNGLVVKDFHNVGHGHSSVGIKEGQESSRVRPGQLLRSPQQCQTTKPPQLAGSVANFSHFSRPAALSKADFDRGGGSKSTKEAPSVATSTKPMESALIDCTGVRGTSTSAGYNTSAPEANLRNSSFAASLAIGRHEAEKGPEPVVASSVCSGSSDPKQRQRRKNREGEESGYQSEDLDDDSVGVRKPTKTRAGTSTKRSRAAEVHNLSERRRRDRINEKMRALQELIPNCNKVDKASMLDEAIEYLKTLQLQVQMMSMGSGLCMSPMMLPPMGLGMGMGMGYGMGILDMNASPGCPLMPGPPPLHSPRIFPCTSMAGATGLHGMPGSSTGLQLFGVPGQGQGLPVSVPHAQFFGTFPGQLPSKANPLNGVSGTMVNPVPVLDAAPPPSRCNGQQQQQQQNMNMENTQKASTSESQVEKDSLLQISDQVLHVGQNGAVNSISDNTKHL